MSKISDEFKTKSFDNFKTTDKKPVITELFQTAKKYVQDFEEIKKERKNSLAFLGNPGTGKTHLIMAVCNELMKQGHSVVYFPWVEGWNEIKDDFELLNKRIVALQRCEVLFIDDLYKGRAQPTPFQLEQLFAVVNDRYLERKPILISSEKTFEQILTIDEGIASRLYEMCKDYKVQVQGNPIELNHRLR